MVNKSIHKYDCVRY